MIKLEKEPIYGDSQNLVEMAIINPKMCRNLSIQVEVEQRGERDIPHMHVYLDKTRNKQNCAYVRLDAAAYSKHHKNGKTLNKKQKDEFISLMKSSSNYFMPDKEGNPVRINWYQNAVLIWAETFEDGELSKFTLDDRGIPVMPDYENLL